MTQFEHSQDILDLDKAQMNYCLGTYLWSFALSHHGRRQLKIVASLVPRPLEQRGLRRGAPWPRCLSGAGAAPAAHAELPPCHQW